MSRKRAVKRKSTPDPILQDLSVTSMSDNNSDAMGPSDSSFFQQMADYEVVDGSTNATDNVSLRSGPFPPDSTIDISLEIKSPSPVFKRPFNVRSRKKLKDNLLDSILNDSAQPSEESLTQHTERRLFQRKEKIQHVNEISFNSTLKDSDTESPTQPTGRRLFQRKGKSQPPNESMFDFELSDDSLSKSVSGFAARELNRQKTRRAAKNKENALNYLFDEDLDNSHTVNNSSSSSANTLSKRVRNARKVRKELSQTKVIEFDNLSDSSITDSLSSQSPKKLFKKRQCQHKIDSKMFDSLMSNISSNPPSDKSTSNSEQSVKSCSEKVCSVNFDDISDITECLPENQIMSDVEQKSEEVNSEGMSNVLNDNKTDLDVPMIESKMGVTEEYSLHLTEDEVKLSQIKINSNNSVNTGATSRAEAKKKLSVARDSVHATSLQLHGDKEIDLICSTPITRRKVSFCNRMSVNDNGVIQELRMKDSSSLMDKEVSSIHPSDDGPSEIENNSHNSKDVLSMNQDSSQTIQEEQTLKKYSSFKDQTASAIDPSAIKNLSESNTNDQTSKDVSKTEGSDAIQHESTIKGRSAINNTGFSIEPLEIESTLENNQNTSTSFDLHTSSIKNSSDTDNYNSMKSSNQETNSDTNLNSHISEQIECCTMDEKVIQEQLSKSDHNGAQLPKVSPEVVYPSTSGINEPLLTVNSPGTNLQENRISAHFSHSKTVHSIEPIETENISLSEASEFHSNHITDTSDSEESNQETNSDTNLNSHISEQIECCTMDEKVIQEQLSKSDHNGAQLPKVSPEVVYPSTSGINEPLLTVNSPGTNLQENRISAHFSHSKTVHSIEPIETENISLSEASEFHSNHITDTSDSEDDDSNLFHYTRGSNKENNNSSRNKQCDEVSEHLASTSVHQSKPKVSSVSAESVFKKPNSQFMTKNRLPTLNKKRVQEILDKIPLSELKDRRRKCRPSVSEVQKEQNEIEQHLMKRKAQGTKLIRNNRLKRPRKWVSPKLYEFLIDKLTPKFNIRSRVKAESVVLFLVEHVDNVLKEEDNYFEIVEEMKIELANLNIIVSHWDFYNFVHKYFDGSFTKKVYPTDPKALQNPLEPDDLYDSVL